MGEEFEPTVEKYEWGIEYRTFIDGPFDKRWWAPSMIQAQTRYQIEVGERGQYRETPEHPQLARLIRRPVMVPEVMDGPTK